MKKILIGTSALVATASIAAAETSLDWTGSARFGVAYNEANDDKPGGETRIEQRLRLNMRGTTTTDTGMEFSARIRFEANEAADDSISGTGNGAAEFTVKSGGFRLDLGNTSDLIDGGSVVNFYGNGIGFTSFLDQRSNFSEGFPLTGFGAGDSDKTTLTLQYAIGDLTVGMSYSDNESAIETTSSSVTVPATSVPGDELDVNTTTTTTESDERIYMIGAGYAFGKYDVGIAYGDQQDDVKNKDNDFWVASFGGEVGDMSFTLVVGDSDDADDTMFGGSLSYNMSASTSIRVAFSEGGADASDTSYGIGFRHSLGGGVTLAGGIGEDKSGNSVADLGVSFSF